jgi:hypothetical protein
VVTLLFFLPRFLTLGTIDSLQRRIELWWEPTRALPESVSKPGAISVAPDFF